MKPKTHPANLKALATLLSDNEYHSGTDIGVRLGLTRSGIWKLVKQLESLDIVLDSVSNKGYRLLRRLELLDESLIKQHLDKNHESSISQLFIFDEVSSTNDYLIQHARQHKGKNAVCMAERQTAGRGRLGRQWVSPFAANIYLSLLWHFDADISELGGLNIVIAVTIAQVILAATPIMDLKLKWPNDIYWQNQKLGGVLIDIVGEFSGGCAAVIGIGINVNMPDASSLQIEKPWTDLRTATGEPVSRNQLAGLLLNQLILNLRLLSESGTGYFIQLWNKMDYLVGKQVSIQSLNAKHEGVAEKVNEQGHLLIKTSEGGRVALTVGDASILRF
jgi:BirA family biotin operon repressor/biotin-[acetyl-CoA-carboxylase] ligase